MRSLTLRPGIPETERTVLVRVGIVLCALSLAGILYANASLHSPSCEPQQPLDDLFVFIVMHSKLDHLGMGAGNWTDMFRSVFP